MNEKQIQEKINYLQQHIPNIKNKQIKLQQQKYLHKLQKQLKLYNFNKGVANGKNKINK